MDFRHPNQRAGSHPHEGIPLEHGWVQMLSEQLGSAGGATGAGAWAQTAFLAPHNRQAAVFDPAELMSPP